MLKHFTYTKDSKEVSSRVAYPLTVLDANTPDAKLQCIDMSDFSDEERAEAERVLSAIRKEFLDAVYAAGFARNFRSFFLRGIS
jgi:hypothetical protein